MYLIQPLTGQEYTRKYRFEEITTLSVPNLNIILIKHWETLATPQMPFRYLDPRKWLHRPHGWEQGPSIGGNPWGY